jgi:WD40 repeat protein
LGSALVVWDATTGQERFSLKSPGGKLGEFAFSPDGKLLAAATWDRDAIIWDLEKRQDGGGGQRRGVVAWALIDPAPPMPAKETPV